MKTDDEILQQLAGEVAAHPPMDLAMRAETVLHLAGLLQLALRHPKLGEPSRAVAQRFLTSARAYFADCPAALEVLRRGDDPSEDR